MNLQTKVSDTYFMEKVSVEPEDVIKHYLSHPHHLREWLREKGKAYAGVSIDCSQCVMSTFMSEMLTTDGFEVERVEFSNRMAEVSLEECDVDVQLPEWVQRFIKAIDSHRNPVEDWMKSERSKIFSGNLARNILRVTLANMPTAVE